MNEVEEFIETFLNKHNLAGELETQFANGFCYHFAIMLKGLFNRGEIVWAAPFGHIMWKDVDEVPYDIYGAYGSEYEYLIPIEYLGEDIKDFTHLSSNNKRNGASKERIQEIIDNYLRDKNVKKVVDE